ncbi:MAG: hypothetical protein PHS49_02010 [Candidatus Gracilibacteria bacterium]|nr:hypothetical protein [Candidatus Gracilibacteria bacterium]
MEKEILNLSNQIQGDKSLYIGKMFFEKLRNSDENIQKFSSLISDILFSNLSGKNPSDNFKKIKNSKAAKYPQHIIQSFGFYILVKYNNTNKSIETTEQTEQIVNNFFNEIEKLSEEQLKNLFKNIFNITKKTFGEITQDYNKISKINNSTNTEVHRVLTMNDKNLNDITINKTNIAYLPKILQYLIYPELGINGTNNILENNLDTDKKSLKSNFSTFTEIFKLKNTFKSINEIYLFFDKYFKKNNTQKIVDFYRYYDEKNDTYKNEMYLVQENQKLNYTNIFFQWFIEQKKQNKINFTKTIEGNKSNKPLNDNTELCLNDILDEFAELTELFGEKIEKNTLNNSRISPGNQKIYDHLFSIDDGFFHFEELTNILKKIDKIPNNFNLEEIDYIFINIELVPNGITLTHGYKVFKHDEYILPISKISFLKDENNNIIYSENYNEIFKEILQYIDGYLDKSILKENSETLKYLILNGIITNLVGLRNQKDSKGKLAYLLNGFNIKEKSEAEDKKYEQNLFPIKNVKHQMDYKSLDETLLIKNDELFIGELKIDLPNLNDILENNNLYNKLVDTKDNKIEITKDILIKFIQEGNIKSFTKLANFIELNRNTLDILKQHTNHYTEVKNAINELEKYLYEQNWHIKLGSNYTTMLKNIFKLYELSNIYDLNINQNEIKRILKKIDTTLIVRYLGLVRVNDNSSYNLIVEYLNEDINYKVKDLLYNKELNEYFEEKIEFKKYISIYDKIEQIIETILIYVSVIKENNLEILKKSIKSIFVEKYINYFEKLLQYAGYNNNNKNDDNSFNNDFYAIFYVVKRLIKIVSTKINIEGIDFGFFDSDHRIKNYDVEKFINRTNKKRLKDRSKSIHNKEKGEGEGKLNGNNIKQNIKTSYNNSRSIKDIYSSIDKYIETISIKYKLYNHLTNIDKNISLSYIEDLLSNSNDITYFFDNNKQKTDFILFFISKITGKGINIYESEIISNFLITNFELFKNNYLKQNYLNYLSQLGIFEYIYSQENGTKNNLSKENVLFIEKLLNENNDIYETAKNYILFVSREIHNNQIAKL